LAIKYKREAVNKKRQDWPRKDKLEEAIDVMWRFKSMCNHQLDLGYWVTMDYPTKHHINKILSLQYMDAEVIRKVYGSKLAQRALELIPNCKLYIAFTKEYDSKHYLEDK